MKKLKLNKQTVSILGTIEQKNIAGGETTSSPCLNWTSYLKSACVCWSDRCPSEFTCRCNQPDI